LPQAGSSFGDYDLLAEVARGGMGVVYKARQRSLNRVVALKMVLGGGRVSATDRERFLVEARAVARLNHPHIVPIYEVGEHHGQSYFTMEFFAGDSLRGRIEEFRRDQRAISRLMATVARAVEHAHRRGILHRDLKPGNVLLDERREPHVTDFGLAKRLDEESDLTQAGAIVGTPSYMAPEQANAQADLSTAVDVYGLGAVLYELLTGRPPFRGQTPMETLLSVMSGEPPRPRKLDGQVDADLETICLKCLAKDPLARYGSADALADDLERWLAGEPIQARRASLRERAVKWARRQPVLAGAFGAAAILALGCLVACGLSWRNAELRAEAVSDLGHARQQLAAANDDVEKAKSLADKQRELADRQKQLADEQKQLAEQTRGEVERLKQAAEVETAKAAAAQKQRELAEQQARRTLYAADMQLAHVAWQTEDMGTLSELVERYRDPAGQEDLRGFEWHYLNRQARGGRLAWQASQEPGHFKTSGVAISPDGKTVATVFTYYAGKTTIKTWSLADGKLLRTMDAGQATVTGLFFTVQGRELVAVVHEELDVLRKRSVLQAAAKKKEKLDIGFLKDQFEYRTWSLDQDDPPRVEPFDPARLRCRVSVGAIGSCLTQHEGEILSVLSLTTSPDGKYLALGGAALDHRFGFVAAPRGRLILWDISRGAVHGQAQSPRWIVEAAAFSPDGKRLAIGHEEGTIEVREVVTAGQPQRLIRHPGQVFALQFSPDSARLASGAGSGQVQLMTPVTRRTSCAIWPRASNAASSGKAFCCVPPRCRTTAGSSPLPAS
jgi:tRNA A-37 threonylcarbamoyl transferase component Bud32